MTIRSQILDYVTAYGPCTRTSILKFLLPLVKGRPYNRATDRGWYSAAFQVSAGYNSLLGKEPTSYPGYLMRPTRNDRRYLRKDKRHLYSVVNK